MKPTLRSCNHCQSGYTANHAYSKYCSRCIHAGVLVADVPQAPRRITYAEIKKLPGVNIDKIHKRFERDHSAGIYG